MYKIKTDDIRRLRSQSRVFQQDGIDAVVDKCYQRVRSVINSDRRSTSCVFDVPEFVLGQPIYDFTDCVIQVKRHMEGSGFKVTYVFPRILVVSWSHTLGNEDQRRITAADFAVKKSGTLMLSF
jgi:hypothetical protein